jgi:hypothetical protein
MLREFVDPVRLTLFLPRFRDPHPYYHGMAAKPPTKPKPQAAAVRPRRNSHSQPATELDQFPPSSARARTENAEEAVTPSLVAHVEEAVAQTRKLLREAQRVRQARRAARESQAARKTARSQKG